ncbi:MAG: glycoside hydrolase family 5 protein, partial [Bacteroidota bacterium]
MIILPLKILLVSLLAIVWIPAPAFAQGFLRAEGQRIVNESGEEVLLRGMGLGGWMLQEGYMLRTSGPQYRIEERIEELVGHDRKEEFYDAWLANHMRRIDVDSMAAWGFNSVRPALHYKWFTPPIEEEPVPGDITWHSKGFEMLDDLLDWASANEMYVILDLHAAPGGQGKNADINDYNPEKPSLWESEANQEKTVALWQKLAERYADHPWIGGYDIINEPNWGFQDIEGDPNGCSETENAPLWELSQRITEAIRQVDQNHIVIIEGNCWGNNYRGLPELWDDNLVISFHKYWNYNDVASIQHMLEMREERNVPIWLGETGENSNTWFTDAIELLEAHDIGWAWWPLKKIGINNPLEIRTNPGYERIRAYWRGEDERPTQDEAFRALMQLADDLKLENNVVRRDVIDAMMRQPHTDNVIPFKDHVVSAVSPTRISAVDFDLGRAGFAYNDNHLANYRVSTGGPST